MSIFDETRRDEEDRRRFQARVVAALHGDPDVPWNEDGQAWDELDELAQDDVGWDGDEARDQDAAAPSGPSTAAGGEVRARADR